MLSVRGQRELASWLADLPVLMLDATRRIDDARRVFLDVDLTETPHVESRQIIDGSAGRLSPGIRHGSPSRAISSRSPRPPVRPV